MTLIILDIVVYLPLWLRWTCPVIFFHGVTLVGVGVDSWCMGIMLPTILLVIIHSLNLFRLDDLGLVSPPWFVYHCYSWGFDMAKLVFDGSYVVCVHPLRGWLSLLMVLIGRATLSFFQSFSPVCMGLVTSIVRVGEHSSFIGGAHWQTLLGFLSHGTLEQHWWEYSLQPVMAEATTIDWGLYTHPWSSPWRIPGTSRLKFQVISRLTMLVILVALTF